jgi:hypothetical protein
LEADNKKSDEKLAKIKEFETKLKENEAKIKDLETKATENDAIKSKEKNSDSDVAK